MFGFMDLGFRVQGVAMLQLCRGLRLRAVSYEFRLYGCDTM